MSSHLESLNRLKSKDSSPPVPGPFALPVIGHFLEARRDVLGMLERGARTYGATVRYRFGPYDFIIVSHPDDVRHVLVQNAQNYRKSPSYAILRAVLGNGLLTSEGETWRRNRRLAQPPFHHRSLAGFASTMSRLTLEVARRWERCRGTIDIHEEMMTLTLRIVGQTLLSTDLASDANRLGAALGEVLDYAQSMETALLLPEWVPTAGRARLRRAINELDAVVLPRIAERRRQSDPPKDLLTMLISATDEDDKSGLSDGQLRDEVMTLILAGHETTAVALSWTWKLLSEHPEVYRILCREIDQHVGEGELDLETVGRLEYTRAVIKEAMRLYPPAWMIERQAIGPDRVGGFEIPEGWLVGVSPWLLHRSPAIYENPEAFDPQRFLGQEAQQRPRYAYLPFGAGPRTCIGNGFAMMEAVIIVALLARRFRLTLAPGQTVAPQPGVTLRPDRGIEVEIRRR